MFTLNLTFLLKTKQIVRPRSEARPWKFAISATQMKNKNEAILPTINQIKIIKLNGRSVFSNESEYILNRASKLCFEVTVTSVSASIMPLNSMDSSASEGI